MGGSSRSACLSFYDGGVVFAIGAFANFPAEVAADNDSDDGDDYCSDADDGAEPCTEDLRELGGVEAT